MNDLEILMPTLWLKTNQQCFSEVCTFIDSDIRQRNAVDHSDDEYTNHSKPQSICPKKNSGTRFFKYFFFLSTRCSIRLNSQREEKIMASL